MNRLLLIFFVTSFPLLLKALATNKDSIASSKQLQTRELKLSDPEKIKVCPNIAGMNTFFPIRTDQVINRHFIMRSCKKDLPIKEQQIIADSFMKALQQDPWAGELINITLANTPGFRIEHAEISQRKRSSRDEIKADAGASLHGVLHINPAMIATGTVSTSLITHEILHLFIMLANDILSKRIAKSMSYCYPNTPEQKAKFLKCIEDDSARIEQLRGWLRKEKNGQLSLMETEKLAQWRKLADRANGPDTNNPNRYYIEIVSELDHEWIDKYKRGGIIGYHDDAFPAYPYNTLIESVKTAGNKMIIKLYIEDPLWAVVATYDKTKRVLQDVYKQSEDMLLEEFMPNMLGGQFPWPLREVFCPSLFNYTNSIKAAVKQELSYHPSVPAPFSPGYTHHFAIASTRLLTWNSYCTADNAESILDEIGHYVDLGMKHEECEYAARALINKGFAAGIKTAAHVFLGVIYAARNDDKSAFKEFHTALRHTDNWKAKLPSGRTIKFDSNYFKFSYAKSAWNSGHLKLANKLCKELLKQNEFRWSTSIEKIEFDAKYKEHCQNITFHYSSRSKPSGLSLS